jgi:Tol biopolymer transport system component
VTLPLAKRETKHLWYSRSILSGWLGRWTLGLIVSLCYSLPVAPAPIVFEGVGDGSHDGVFVISPDGSQITVLDSLGSDPALSPNGQSVLLTGGDGMLWEMSPDGNSKRSLGLSGRNPSWSVDGTRIAFMRRSVLLVASLDGSNVREVAPSANTAQWSPSDRDILYYSFSFQTDGSTLNKVDVATGDTSTVIFGSYIPEVTYPLSPSGDALISIYAQAGYHMSVLNLLTGEFSSIGPSGSDGPQSAAWAPSGDRIAYDVLSGTLGLFVSGPTGEFPTLVVPGTFEAAPIAPAWSPDGTMIAFHMRNLNGGPSRLHVVNADGTDLRYLTLGVSAQWSPMPTFGFAPKDDTHIGAQSWGEIKLKARNRNR